MASGRENGSRSSILPCSLDWRRAVKRPHGMLSRGRSPAIRPINAAE
jgi:hypothetical protein